MSSDLTDMFFIHRFRSAYFVLLAILGVGIGGLHAGDWRFEAAPGSDTAGPFPLKPLSRPDGNRLEAADPAVSAKSPSTKVLANPALMHEGDVGPFELTNVSWTLSGWFRNGEPSGQMIGAQMLAGTRQSSSKFRGWDLCMTDGVLRFFASPPAGTGNKFVTAKRWDDNKWHQFFLVWDAGAHTVTLFVDNEAAGSVNGVPFIPATLGQVFTIGAKILNETLAATGNWEGEFDEWKFEPGTAAPPAGALNNLPAGPQASVPPPAAAPNSQPVTSALRLTPLTGQTALTWKETGPVGRQVLAGDKPITQDNRRNARVVVSGILPGSANDWYEDPKECPKAGSEPPRGWLLGPEASPLAREDGAFVYTFRSDDPAALYFAVAAEDEPIEPGRNATRDPIEPKVAPVTPIAQSPEAAGDMKNVAAGLPVLLELHAHTSRPQGKFTHLLFGSPEMGWRDGLPFKFKVTVNPDHIYVQPYDRVWINRRLGANETPFFSYEGQFRNIETMWYGTNNHIDSPTERARGVAVNYTDRWVLAVLEWVVKNYRADARHVYGCGASMGTAIQRIAFNHPDRFALVDVRVPFVDWSYVEGKDDLARRMQASCGPIDMPTDKGTPLAEEINLLKIAGKAPGDLTFVIFRAGLNDVSVFWKRMPDYFRTMNQYRQGLLAAWDEGDHLTAMKNPLPDFPDFRSVPWYAKRFALDQSYLAISDCSLNSNFGDGTRESADPQGFINRGMEWTVLADEKDRYQVKVFCTLPDARFPVTAAITPRRLQNFHPAGGETLLARNDETGGKPVSHAEVTADSAGRITIANFSLTSPAGNILTLQRKL